MRERMAGLTALVTGVVLIWGLPTASLSQGEPPRSVAAVLEEATTNIEGVVKPTTDRVQKPVSPLRAGLDRATAGKTAPSKSAGRPRATSPNPQTDPPLHGTNNHGQGTVGVIDLAPSSERPQGGETSGSDAGPEEIVAGRARGEQQADGKYRGRITIAALLGREILGVTTTEGQTQNGPLQPVQTAVLDPLCNGTAEQICLSVLTANSSTTTTGSTNDFAVARAQLGGPTGIGVGAAESQGTITQDANCQTSTGVAKTANVTSGGGAVASAANSSSTSRSCRGQAAQVTNTSEVIGLGGTGVPLPAAGCANGTPDTSSGIPTVLPIICNADTIAGAAGVREALSVFVLSVGGTSLAKETTGASESMSTAPAAAAVAPTTQTAPTKPTTPTTPKTPKTPTTPPSPDPGPGDNNGGDTECSDGTDNDGDGVIDQRDPGCHTDGDPDNPASYDPQDDSEDNGDQAAGGTLPFTGTDVTALILAGVLMLAGGLLLRRQPFALSAR